MIIFTVGAVGNIVVIYGFKSNKKLRQERDLMLKTLQIEN